MAFAGGGRSKPNIKDVASHAGVALSSVSRVLNNHPDASPEMRARVFAAVAALGYEPDLLASGLRRGVSKTIGFIVTDIANPLFADMVKGAESTLNDAGYSLVLINSEGDPLRDERAVRLLARRRVDGLVLSISDETRVEIHRTLSSLTVPTILLDREMESVPQTSAVLSDHVTGMRAATDHLLEIGHERIALLAGPLNIRPGRERLRGFKDAYRRRKVPVPRDLLMTGANLSAEFGEKTTDRLLGLPRAERPTAVIVGGNLVLVGVLRALRRHAVRVGTDVALVSCDEVPLTEFHTPSITVVARDTVEMGAVAARLMLDQLEVEPGAREPRVELLDTHLVVRDSTAATSPDG